MTSAYGGAKANETMRMRERELLPYLPLKENLPPNAGENVVVDFMEERDVKESHALLNEVIEEGRAWPFEELLSREEFCGYFMSGTALVVRILDVGNSGTEVIGAFYVKSNFPGRSSHFANGGFITKKSYRRRGVGTLMAEVYKRVAKDLGYRAVLFNLVYTSNVASMKLWRKMGFKVVGTLPRVGRLKGLGYIDADMMFLDLTENNAGVDDNCRRIPISIPWKTAVSVLFGVVVAKVIS